MQQIKFECAQVVKPQPSHIHFLDRGPYHQNKVSCPDLIIYTQLTNITLNRLELNQSIPRCDNYCKFNRACFMPAKEMFTTEIASEGHNRTALQKGAIMVKSENSKIRVLI